jgi:hypothetical protein
MHEVHMIKSFLALVGLFTIIVTLLAIAFASIIDMDADVSNVSPSQDNASEKSEEKIRCYSSSKPY